MTARPLPVALAPASIGTRAAACAVDLLVASAVGVMCAGVAVAARVVAESVRMATGPWAFVAGDGRAVAFTLLLALGAAWAGMLAWAVVHTAMQGGAGSVGQRAFGLRLGDEAGAGPIGFWRALARNVVWALSCGIFVGWFTPLFDAGPRHQGWHDRATRAVVLATRGADAAPAASPAGVAPAAATPTPATPAAATPGAASDPHPWFLDVPAPTSAPATAVIPQVPAAPAPPPPAPPVLVPAASVPTPLAESAQITGQRAEYPSLALSRQARATEVAAAVPSIADRAALYAEAPVIAVLTWDDGARMAVYGRTLYGRNPAVETGSASVPVRDETLSLSKTHFEIGGDASGAWIADRHSTNGTVLVRDGGRHPLVAGRPTPLRAGDRLELGDRTAVVGLAP